MAIKAIETMYEGFRFRSRLEARWAVFLDECQLRWDYEPEGYEIMLAHRRIKYLPDFWLHCGQWAEVKGYLDMNGMFRLYEIAGAMTECEKGDDIVILGNIPKSHSILWPVQLHKHGEQLWGVPWDPYVEGCALARPRVAIEPTQEMAQRLTSGFPFGCPDWAEDAIDAARQARFEWGEHG